MKLIKPLSLICLVGIILTGCYQTKTIQQNESIARSFIEAYDTHNANKLTSLFTDKFLYTEVPSGRTYSNSVDLASYMTKTIAGVPDTKFEIVSVIANEEYAAVEWIWKGTNSVGWDFMGIPATGKYFELPGVSVMEIENQKIIRNSDYWDWNTFMQLLGVMP